MAVEVTDLPDEMAGLPVQPVDLFIEEMVSPVELADSTFQLLGSPTQLLDVTLQLSDSPVELSNQTSQELKPKLQVLSLKPAILPHFPQKTPLPAALVELRCPGSQTYLQKSYRPGRNWTPPFFAYRW